MHLILIGLIILLSSCASNTMGNYYSQTVQSWRGGYTQALVQRWGTPDQKLISPNGNTFFVYKSESYRPYSSPSSPMGINFRSGSDAKPVILSIPNNTWNRGTMSVNCIAAFEADQTGKIIRTEVIGQGCYGSQNFASRRGNPRSSKGL